MGDFDHTRAAAREVDAEVDREAAELVRRGVPMWDAIAKAQDNIRFRRSRQRRVVVDPADRKRG